VRIEREGGHRFVTDVVEAFPGEIEAVSIAKPSLEDIFIRRTGHRFWSEQGNEDIFTTETQKHRENQSNS
jgi:ABC-2 type transport system ATP-binding protein